METTQTWVHPFEAAGLGKAPFRYIGYEHRVFRATPDAPAQPGSSCDFCGTGISNIFNILSADNRSFKVGCDCVYKTYRTAAKDKLFDDIRKADRKMRAERRATLALEKRAKVREARRLVNLQRAQDFIAATPGLEQALAFEHPIIADIASKLNQYGDLSPRQVDFVFKLYAENYGPAKPAEVQVPAPEGKQTVRGTVISTRVVEGFYGTTTKMTVKVTNGRDVWLCWGTVPGSLHDLPGGGFRTSDSLRGCEVEFNATLVRGREPHFAFFKRPTKARITKDNQ